MKKLTFTIVAILICQILPLLAAPHLLLHWKMLAITAAAAAIWLSQPAIQSPKTTDNNSRDRNTMWLILAMAGVATIVPEIEWAYGRTDHSGTIEWNIAGLAMMAGGIVFRIWAIRTLGRFFTAAVQTSEAQVLLESGPYALLRHPSYLGAYVAIVGCAVLLQAWWGASIAITGVFYAYYQRISAEEIALEAHFGEAYQAYQARTWRMFPGLW